MLNKRLHSRISLKVLAELSSRSNTLYKGYAKNFSFGGMFLNCAQAVYLPSKHICRLRIFFSETDEGRIVELKCRCIRTNEEGFAVRFVSITQDHYALLQELIREQTDEAEKLFEENLKNSPFLIGD